MEQKWSTRQSFSCSAIISINVDVVCLDSTTVKVHTDACGALKKEENRQWTGRAVDFLQKSMQSLRDLP